MAFATAFQNKNDNDVVGPLVNEALGFVSAFKKNHLAVH